MVVPLREELDYTHIRLARRDGRGPGRQPAPHRDSGGPRRDAGLRPPGGGARVGVARAPDPGLAEHGIGFKTLAEAAALRNRAIQHLEIAEGIEDPEERREWLTFVFVGAGYAGLEGIAELQDYVADMLVQYPRCRLDGTRWVLVEAGDRVMQEISAGLARFATEQLRGRGMEIRTRTRRSRR